MKIHKDGSYTRTLQILLKNILAAVPHKTADVWPLTSHLTKHPSKKNKTFWELREK